MEGSVRPRWAIHLEKWLLLRFFSLPLGSALLSLGLVHFVRSGFFPWVYLGAYHFRFSKLRCSGAVVFIQCLIYSHWFPLWLRFFFFFFFFSAVGEILYIFFFPLRFSRFEFSRARGVVCNSGAQNRHMPVLRAPGAFEICKRRGALVSDLSGGLNRLVSSDSRGITRLLRARAWRWTITSQNHRISLARTKPQ